MLFAVVLRDYPKQVVSLTKAKSVPTNMREFLSWAQRHYRIDVTASTVERKTGGPASAGTCPALNQVKVQDLRYRSEGRTSSSAARPSYMFSSTHGPQGEPRTHAKRHILSIVGLTLVLFRVRSSTLSRQHVQLLSIAMKS